MESLTHATLSSLFESAGIPIADGAELRIKRSV
jgi:hypothetical protein